MGSKPVCQRLECAQDQRVQGTAQVRDRGMGEAEFDENLLGVGT
jgi:hypothetical protein